MIKNQIKGLVCCIDAARVLFGIWLVSQQFHFPPSSLMTWVKAAEDGTSVLATATPAGNQEAPCFSSVHYW